MGLRPRGKCTVCQQYWNGRWDGESLRVGSHRVAGSRCEGSGELAMTDGSLNRVTLREAIVEPRRRLLPAEGVAREALG